MFILASSVCKSFQCIICTLRVTYLGSLVQLCCGEGVALQTNVTGVCGERLKCLSHTGFAPLTVCVLSWSTLLRLQIARQGYCLRRARGCVYFPRLCCSGSGSWVLHKGWAGVLRPSQVRAAQCGASHHLPGPAAQVPECAVGTLSQVGHVSPLGS